MIVKWSRIAEYETLVILVQCLISYYSEDVSGLWVLQAIQVLLAMGFPDQAMGLSDDIEMESNRRVRDPCDPGSVSDLIFKGSFRSSRLSRSSRLWDFQIRLWDFQMILKLAVAANTSVQASNLY